jgi:NADPH-dependent methylglyoxal reductase
VILGPPVQYVGQGSIAKGHTNMSSDLFYNAFLRPNPPADATPSLYNGYIDVRDLAKLHVRSVVESGGKSSRLLLTSPEPFFAHTALEILNRRFPQLQNRLKSVLAVRIVANKEQDLEHPLRVDDSEAKALFGNNIYRSFEDTVVDTTTRLLEIEN